jgi:hypothetical protein
MDTDVHAMTGVERAGGDRVVAAARSNPRDRPRALKEGRSYDDLGGDDCAHRADPAWLTSGLVAYLDGSATV